VQEDFQQHFPNGPSTLEELFDWHNYNAKILLADPILKQRFKSLLTKVDKIVVHEDFAGMGTAGVSLVQQLQAFSSVLSADQDDGDSTLVSFFARHDDLFPF